MKADILTACRRSTIQEHQIIIDRAIEEIGLKVDLPVDMKNLCLAARIRFLPHEAGHRDIEIRFIDPDGMQMYTHQFPAKVASKDSGDETIVRISVQIDHIRFTRYGPHRIDLLVDGKTILESGFLVTDNR